MPDLRDLLPWRQPERPHPLVHIRPELLTAVQKIAAQENRPVGAVVNDLLQFALAERREAHAALITWQELTSREKEVAVLIWLGLTNPEIAARLVLSPNTIKTHIRHILAKFNLSSKEELRLELATLDFSEWLDSWMVQTDSPTNSGSPDGATP